MSSDFHLLDLPSQGFAVQRLLKGLSSEEKLAWLAARGELSEVPISLPNVPPTYRFVSTIGMECLFFIVGDNLAFIGDNTTYAAKEYDPVLRGPERVADEGQRG